MQFLKFYSIITQDQSGRYIFKQCTIFSIGSSLLIAVHHYQQHGGMSMDRFSHLCVWSNKSRRVFGKASFFPSKFSCLY